jgi:hypothetical protein
MGTAEGGCPRMLRCSCITFVLFPCGLGCRHYERVVCAPRQDLQPGIPVRSKNIRSNLV